MNLLELCEAFSVMCLSEGGKTAALEMLRQMGVDAPVQNAIANTFDENGHAKRLGDSMVWFVFEVR